MVEIIEMNTRDRLRFSRDEFIHTLRKDDEIRGGNFTALRCTGSFSISILGERAKRILKLRSLYRKFLVTGLYCVTIVMGEEEDTQVLSDSQVEPMVEAVTRICSAGLPHLRRATPGFRRHGKIRSDFQNGSYRAWSMSRGCSARHIESSLDSA